MGVERDVGICPPHWVFWGLPLGESVIFQCGIPGKPCFIRGNEVENFSHSVTLFSSVDLSIRKSLLLLSRSKRVRPSYSLLLYTDCISIKCVTLLISQ